MDLKKDLPDASDLMIMGIRLNKPIILREFLVETRFDILL